MKFLSLHNVYGTVMQIEKALGNDPLLVSKVSWNFAFQLFVILQQYLPVMLLSWKVAYFLTVSVVFSIYK